MLVRYMTALLSTTLTAPRALADLFLSLTDVLPTISLDVAEDPAEADNYRYTFFLSEDTKEPFLAALDILPPQHFATPCTFDIVDTSIDYIAQNRAAFPPLTIGPFFVARNDEDQPAGLIKLDIMPNRAFGSGEHATTTGCLLAYTHLVQSGQTFAKGLDFGAGSGILAIAAAKQNGTPFLCIDIDAPSVAINNQNAQLNGVTHLVQAIEGETPPAGQTFNLIFANILLQPLVELAPALTSALATGGSLILSGFTTDQSADIATRYTSFGLKKVWEHQQGDWLAQIWQHASA
ncbi:MAG: methyltransferase domain-containing protein [Alphaproteobacteria bacterium]|nr:MAG: methyltransferase domain-containing protein [Alphaproteobacteria bacterium]